MTNFLLGGILTFAVATAVECYLLLGRVQLLFNHAELILRAAHTLLSAIPGKSAARTLAALDEQPRRWWQTLRRLAELRDHLDQVAGNEPDEDLIEHPPEPSDEDPELARWADDGGSGVKEPLTAEDASVADADTEAETPVDEDQTPTETFPPVPVTEPVERIEIAGGLRLPSEDHELPEQLDSPPIASKAAAIAAAVTDGEPTPPIVDDVDLQLARWGLRTAEGHRPVSAVSTDRWTRTPRAEARAAKRSA